MTYGLLCGGVKGVLYFTYELKSWKYNIENYGRMWSGLKSLARELNDLQQILLSVEPAADISVKPEGLTVLWMIRRYSDADHLFVVNLQNSKVEKVFTFADGRTVGGEEVFTGRKTAVKGGEVRLTLDPNGVQYIRVPGVPR